jgi:Spy/CpxP family protein refolding chaperone
MLGFLIGTVCLIGLIKTLRWGRHGHGGYGYGGGCGGGGYGRRGWGGDSWGDQEHRGGWGGGRNMMLRGLFHRLDTTPGQEKAIKAALEELYDATRSARGEVSAARADVAKVMRSPAVDEVLFGEMFSRHDNALETLRKAGIGAIAKVHDALDEKQRARLADLIESGPGAFRGGPWNAPSAHL